MSRQSGHVSGAIPHPLIFGANNTRAIPAFKSQNREMAARDRLEMICEGVIDRRPARGADQRNALGHKLLRDGGTEMAADLCYQADNNRRCLANSATTREIARRFAHRLRQNGANREIAGFQDSSVTEIRNVNIGLWTRNSLAGTGPAAEGKDLEAGKRGSRIGQVLPLGTTNVGNRAQHDRGGKWQFDWQARNTESAAGGSGEDRDAFVQAASVLKRLPSKAPQCEIEPAPHGRLRRPIRDFRDVSRQNRS